MPNTPPVQNPAVFISTQPRSLINYFFFTPPPFLGFQHFSTISISRVLAFPYSIYISISISRVSIFVPPSIQFKPNQIQPLMVRAKLVVFPVKGRIWCFTRSLDSSFQSSSSSSNTNTLKHLWNSLSFKSQPVGANVELVVDFVSDKMNKGWSGLEKAPEKSLKKKIHGVGLWLLSRVKPSEIFLKSISKEVTGVEVTYPTSLNPRLVRRRLRHIAMSGTIIHKKCLYGSATLLPITTVFMVLPLPNIPFFWLLYRTYSHWRALQGSEKLLQLVSNDSTNTNSKAKKDDDENSQPDAQHKNATPWVLRPCKELEELIRRGSTNDGLSKCGIKDICKTFELNPQDALKYHKL